MLNSALLDISIMLELKQWGKVYPVNGSGAALKRLERRGLVSKFKKEVGLGEYLIGWRLTLYGKQWLKNLINRALNDEWWSAVGQGYPIRKQTNQTISDFELIRRLTQCDPAAGD